MYLLNMKLINMDLEKLIINCNYYRKLSSTTNPFAYKQSDYDKYLYYKKKLKEYAQKEGYKPNAKAYPNPFIRMSDWTEEFENTKI